MTGSNQKGQVSDAIPRPDAPEIDADVDTDRPDELVELLLRVSLPLRLRGADLETVTGLAGRELDLVQLLSSAGPTSVKSLVADLGLPRSTMTAIVDRLQERGLVTRLPNPQDRRSVILEATASAQTALVQYRNGLKSISAHIGKTLDDNDRARFVGLLARLAENF